MKKLILLLALTSCASPYWFRNGEPAKTYTWNVVSRQNLAVLCQTHLADACAFQNPGGTCYIYSFMTEEQAALTFFTHHRNVREHEIKHCEGWNHG